jgi:DNA-binding NtrC family response regulator
MQNALVISSDENLINFIIHDKISSLIRFTHYSDVFRGLRMLTYKNFDILIFDIDSPGVDAAHALNVAKSLQDELHMIIITNDAYILHNKTLEKQSIGRLLFKPIQYEQLSNHLKFVSMNRERNKYIQMNNRHAISNRFADYLKSPKKDVNVKK